MATVKSPDSTANVPPATLDPAAFPVTAERDLDAITKTMVDRMFKTSTLDEMFDVLSGTSAEDLVGRTLQVDSVQWDVYESDKGPIPNAIITALDTSTGEQIEFPCTAPMLTSFVRQAEILGHIPFTAKIEGRRTRSGREALNFVRP